MKTADERAWIDALGHRRDGSDSIRSSVGAGRAVADAGSMALTAMGHFALRAHLPCMTDITVTEPPAAERAVRLAATGDEAAFASLVAEHHQSMAKVAYAITGDVEAARDAVQSAWSIAWRRMATLRDPGRVRAWLIAIAANEARQSLRRQRGPGVVDISAALGAGAAGDPADRIGTVDLDRALRRLKPDDRTLLALRFVAGLDSGEIAAQLGMSASGVRSRLSRLIERLRTELDHA
jgi:RNA polymerase sigma-70 factor (ECF subfamily)